MVQRAISVVDKKSTDHFKKNSLHNYIKQVCNSSYCLRSLTRYSQISYMDEIITK